MINRRFPWAFLTVCLAIFARELVYVVDADVYLKGNSEQRHLRRFKRNEDCSSSSAVNGYLPLEYNNVEVEFLQRGENFSAVIKWKAPTAGNVSIEGFIISWGGGAYNIECQVVGHTTSFFEIQPSLQIWRYNERLHVSVFPLPLNESYTVTMLTFEPKYKALTTPSPSAWSKENLQQSSPNNKSAPNSRSSSRKSPPKVFIGCVTGVCAVIVIVILLISYFCKKRKESLVREGIYYVSYYPENDRFVEEVKKFVCWLRQKGYDVQFDAILDEENARLRRELVQFMFRQHMLEKAKNVFIVLSPSYLRLCEMGKKGWIAQSFSEEDKLAFSEILEITAEQFNKLYQTDRFIPLLFYMREEVAIPYWIKHIGYYLWPEDKTNDKLLKRLNNLPESSPISLA